MPPPPLTAPGPPDPCGLCGPCRALLGRLVRAGVQRDRGSHQWLRGGWGGSQHPAHTRSGPHHPGCPMRRHHHRSGIQEGVGSLLPPPGGGRCAVWSVTGQTALSEGGDVAGRGGAQASSVCSSRQVCSLLTGPGSAVRDGIDGHVHTPQHPSIIRSANPPPAVLCSSRQGGFSPRGASYREDQATWGRREAPVVDSCGCVGGRDCGSAAAAAAAAASLSPNTDHFRLVALTYTPGGQAKSRRGHTSSMYKVVRELSM